MSAQSTKLGMEKAGTKSAVGFHEKSFGTKVVTGATSSGRRTYASSRMVAGDDSGEVMFAVENKDPLPQKGKGRSNSLGDGASKGPLEEITRKVQKTNVQEAGFASTTKGSVSKWLEKAAAEKPAKLPAVEASASEEEVDEDEEAGMETTAVLDESGGEDDAGEEASDEAIFVGMLRLMELCWLYVWRQEGGEGCYVCMRGR